MDQSSLVGTDFYIHNVSYEGKQINVSTFHSDRQKAGRSNSLAAKDGKKENMQ